MMKRSLNPVTGVRERERENEILPSLPDGPQMPGAPWVPDWLWLITAKRADD